MVKVHFKNEVLFQISWFFWNFFYRKLPDMRIRVPFFKCIDLRPRVSALDTWQCGSLQSRPRMHGNLRQHWPSHEINWVHQQLRGETDPPGWDWGPALRGPHSRRGVWGDPDGPQKVLLSRGQRRDGRGILRPSTKHLCWWVVRWRYVLFVFCSSFGLRLLMELIQHFVTYKWHRLRLQWSILKIPPLPAPCLLEPDTHYDLYDVGYSSDIPYLQSCISFCKLKSKFFTFGNTGRTECYCKSSNAKPFTQPCTVSGETNCMAGEGGINMCNGSCHAIKGHHFVL